MQKYRTPLSGLKFFCLSGAIIFLLACSGGQDSDHQPPVSGTTLPQPGMHVYKDPVTGEFLAQPPAEDKSTRHVLPQQVNGLDSETAPAPDRAQEYESPGAGGGTLLDLPAPYSETQE